MFRILRINIFPNIHLFAWRMFWRPFPCVLPGKSDAITRCVSFPLLSPHHGNGVWWRFWDACWLTTPLWIFTDTDRCLTTHYICSLSASACMVGLFWFLFGERPNRQFTYDAVPWCHPACHLNYLKLSQFTVNCMIYKHVQDNMKQNNEEFKGLILIVSQQKCVVITQKCNY